MSRLRGKLTRGARRRLKHVRYEVPDDLRGIQYGRLIPVYKFPFTIDGRTHYRCFCECGGETRAVADDIITGQKRSCGCLRREYLESLKTHGAVGTRTYSVWRGMRARCFNEAVPQFHNYGGRGLTCCIRWDRFENFIADMGEAPDGLTIERIDNNKGYGPDNCRWATMHEQCRNKRTNRWIEHNGERLILQDWAIRYGIRSSTLRNRIERGWDFERALTEPVQFQARKRPCGKVPAVDAEYPNQI